MNHENIKQFLDFCKKNNLNPEDSAHYRLYESLQSTDVEKFSEYDLESTIGKTTTKTKKPVKVKPVKPSQKPKQFLPEEEHDAFAHRTEKSDGSFNFGIEIQKDGKWLKYSPNDIQDKKIAKDIKKMYESFSWKELRSPYPVLKVKVRFGANGSISSTGSYVKLAITPTDQKPIKNALVRLPKVLLDVKSVVIKKDDEKFTKDPLLCSMYNVNDNIKSMNQDVRGRLAEIGFGIAFPDWVWANKTANNSAKYDFVEPISQTTLDVKSIVETNHNLLIEQSKVDNANMANVFSLCLIVEKDNFLHFLFVGFITDVLILKYTSNNPFSLMEDIKKYKIPRAFLLPNYTI